MSSAGSSWLPAGLTWIKPNTFFGFTKEKKGRDLREQIKAISGSSVLDDAGIDDAQVLTLTREDLNELFPGINNFQLRRTVMSLITDTVKDSLRSGPETFAGALKHLMHKNNSNDAAVQDVLKESLQAFREMEEQLKATQAFLKPYIEVLNSLTEASARKEHWDTEGTSSRGKFPSPSQTDLKSPTITTHFVSRSGTDIEEALRKIPADKPAVLVTMYHTFSPNYVCPSYNISSSQVNIVEHVNVLFHDSQQGLLRCAPNEHAITKLQSVLYRYK
ncbi:hypothetical protein DPX16_11255 [Anabarilius grahami]|uniref:Uncharacterized protein n=1 Tax=Anabarilius grahami TaxID=495550 RepID=A0A3N0Z593_ANAGA|nr:hypothetical protein DPX16_11255 [Anabarilius grahami]